VIPAGSSALVLKDLTEPGHYELVEPESRATVGAFSLNPPASESDLTRLTEKDLDDRLGAERYQLAESLEDLKDDINAADIGQEVFPVLLALVIVVFCGEHLVANRFYETPGPAPEGQSKLLSPEPSQRTF
jgi:hypothetical protein